MKSRFLRQILDGQIGCPRAIGTLHPFEVQVTSLVEVSDHELCEAALDGVNDVVEAVRQLRGDAASPVRGARIALAAGSLLEPTSAVLLGRPAPS